MFSRVRDCVCLAVVLIAVWGGSVGLLSAQSASVFPGQWQGTVEAAQPLRVLLRLQPAESGPVQGVVYLLDGDNPDWPHATSALKLDATSVAFRIVNIDVSFQGKLAANGTLAGTWSQHGATTPVTLTHVTGDAAWPVPVSSGKSMPANADPAFDVATIKPADPKDTGAGFQINGQRIHARNESLESIIAVAYKIHPGQIQGAPGWFASQHWEIDGLADTPGIPNLDQMRAMYRKLLTDRFALKLDRQKRDLSVYLLDIAKEGPKLTRSLGNPNGPPDSTGNGSNGIRDVRYTDMTMDEFAEDLAFDEDRPVVNVTKLTGRYDFRLKWARANIPAAAQDADPDAPPQLPTALHEQLGLTLKPAHSPAEVYVVTHVEQPSAN